MVTQLKLSPRSLINFGLGFLGPYTIFYIRSPRLTHHRRRCAR